MCQSSLKESFTAKLMRSCKTNCQTNYRFLKKNTAHSIARFTCLKLMVHKGGYVYALFMNLSKVFDTKHYDLMIYQVRGVSFFTGYSSVHKKLKKSSHYTTKSLRFKTQYQDHCYSKSSSMIFFFLFQNHI